jgi:hypothetical protein
MPALPVTGDWSCCWQHRPLHQPPRWLEDSHDLSQPLLCFERCLCSVQLSKASMGPPASAIASLGGGLLFLGSWAGDSLLVSATRQQTKVRCCGNPQGLGSRPRGAAPQSFLKLVLPLASAMVLRTRRHRWYDRSWAASVAAMSLLTSAGGGGC